MSQAALRLLVHGGGAGAWNMALDESLMRTARTGVVTLRLYRWDPPCLSLGRNQAARDRFDACAAAARGIDVVRRPTGGRAVYHDREVTYAVTAPEGLWGGPRRSYARINRALASGLFRLGAPVRLAARAAGAGLARPDARACFRDPAPGEVTARGRKLVGSAVWRRSGALLQHGSLLVHDDQRVTEELRTDGRGAEAGPAAEAGDRRGRGGRDARHAAEPRAGAESRAVAPPPGSIGLAEACGRVPAGVEILEALVAGFEEEFGLRALRSDPAHGELAEADRLEARYRDRGWTWRR